MKKKINEITGCAQAGKERQRGWDVEQKVER